MEFLRFGSSIPGAYWGCCAVCIIQNFKMDPDEKASIQLVDGDGGTPITYNPNGNTTGPLFAGPTYRDIFWQRLRIGTFSNRNMPNHAFFAILTEWQLNDTHGKKWLAILKEAGFEFIRTVSNSVYAGESLLDLDNPRSEEPRKCDCGDDDCDIEYDDEGGDEGADGSPNYIFGLIRNIGSGAIADPFTPPKAWTDLPKVKPEAWEEMFDEQGSSSILTRAQQVADRAIWDSHEPKPFMTEEALKDAFIPVTLAGRRSTFPQELQGDRATKEKKESVKTKPANAFPGVIKAA